MMIAQGGDFLSFSTFPVSCMCDSVSRKVKDIGHFSGSVEMIALKMGGRG